MGSFFGKLFAGAGDRETAVLRAYGKLPFYAEYRRLEVSPGAPTAFARWLDEGRLAWVRSTPEGTRGTMRASRVVLHWPDHKEWVIGSIWDSRDSLGRPFPFTLFVASPPDALGDGRWERWTSCLAIHEYFDQLHGQLATLGSGGDFYRLYAKHAVPVRLDHLSARAAALIEQARQITLAGWFEAAGLTKLKSGTWFAGLLRRAERWRTPATTAGDPALSCPLARGAPYGPQTLLWLQWLAAVRPTGSAEPALILPTPSAPDPPRAQLLYRDLLPGDFQLLTTDAPAYGYVEDLAQLPPGVPSDAAAPETAAPVGPLLESLLRHAGA